MRLQPYNPPTKDAWECVYQDAHLLVVDKPAGLLSVSGRTCDLQDCLLTRVQERYPYALLVHRLDEATSGLIVFALNANIQRVMNHAFAMRQIGKDYVAVLHGLVAENNGTVDAAVAVDWPRRPAQKIDPTGKVAITHWHVLERNAALIQTRVVLQPRTGRTHQLRVHMQSIGHSIVGDQLYENTSISAAHKGKEKIPRLMLHATALEFTHPITQDLLRCESAVPF